MAQFDCFQECIQLLSFVVTYGQKLKYRDYELEKLVNSKKVVEQLKIADGRPTAVWPLELELSDVNPERCTVGLSKFTASTMCTVYIISNYFSLK